MSTRIFLPGDRVSFINDKLSATVKRIIDKKQVLLLLDDGFEIPASINELVIIQKIGGNREEIANDLTIIADEADKSDKIFFAAVVEDTGKGQLVKAYLINTTGSLLKFALFNTTHENKGIAQGDLEASRAIKLTQFLISEATDYRKLILQAIYYQENPPAMLQPFQVAFKLRPVSIMKEQKLIPVLKLKGFLINLTDYDPANFEKDFEASNLAKAAPAKPESLPDIIDLHLEELTDNPKSMIPHAAYELQMKVFNNTLEKAIAQDMPHITFIHGVGQGRLKGEIRKVLASNPYIQRFEDADPKNFGYGATKVFLKSR